MTFPKLLALTLVTAPPGAYAAESATTAACESNSPDAVAGGSIDWSLSEMVDAMHEPPPDAHWQRERALGESDEDRAALDEKVAQENLTDSQYDALSKIIGAKLHVAYAAINDLSGENISGALQELNEARALLSAAQKDLPNTRQASVAQLLDELDALSGRVMLCHGQAPWQEGHAYKRLVRSLSHLLGAS
jgi:hypothetical protein